MYQNRNINKELYKIDIDNLTKTEKTRFQDAFVAFDKNGSKMIEKDELKKVLEELGHNPTDDDITKMINEVDSSNRGAIGFEDFLRIICYYKEKMANNDEEDIKLVFIALGGDESSMTIQRSQLESAIQNDFALAIDMSRLIKELNPQAQSISYEDFKNLLTSK